MTTLLTILIAAATAIQCVFVALTTHWHHQDRKRMLADEKQMAYEQTEIEALQFREDVDEAEIERMKNERANHRWA